ncbi:unnamed protein product [Prunus armeniaca]
MSEYCKRIEILGEVQILERLKKTIAMPREKGGSQPEFYDKGIVTFEVHHGGRMRERGPIAGNLTAKFEHEDESNEQSDYEGMYEDDEVDEEATNMEEEGDDITIDEAINEEVEGNEEAENEKSVENVNEDNEEHEKDPEFYDSV